MKIFFLEIGEGFFFVVDSFQSIGDENEFDFFDLLLG